MKSIWNKQCELAALMCERSAIETMVHARKVKNAELRGERTAYDEESFIRAADDLRRIKVEIRALKEAE